MSELRPNKGTKQERPSHIGGKSAPVTPKSDGNGWIAAIVEAVGVILAAIFLMGN
ncbi:hypothetical protein [uncultured Roseibium sp.]|uniref:hypothetical protein n=1 Tax=uncultured Roseibium sp. TaxID=1936171 RepID=UPI00321764EB